MKVILLLLLVLSVSAQVSFPDDTDEGQSANESPVTDIGLVELLSTTNRQNFGNIGSCITGGETGTCGPIRQCPTYVPLLSQLRNRAVLSFLRRRICRLLANIVYLCCPNNGGPSTTGLPQPQPQPQPQPSSVLPSSSECGISPVTRVTGGTEIPIGSHPWLAAVGMRLQGGRFFANCGGTLISRRHVLTAAHCFDNPGIVDPSIVILGDHNLQTTADGATPQEFRIAGRRGNGYNRRTSENDIMILILDRDAFINGDVSPACLPFNDPNRDYLNENLLVVGWGRTAFENRRTSPVPNEAYVPVVDTSQCRDYYRNVETQPMVDSRNICAGTGGQDACNGDSGGPLLYVDSFSDQYYVVGVVSFGVKCALPEFPGVYTKVGYFLGWIRNVVENT